jgi:GDPmannose 4,6-dehydratase
MDSSLKNVIVTGVTGQDGSLMVDYLLKNTDLNIYGTARRLSVKNHGNILHLEHEPRFKLLTMDLNDAHSIRDIVIDIKPDFFLNFAAQSFVAGSWDYPIQTWETDSNSVLHILESIRRFRPSCRFYNAGSSEEFGHVEYTPQDESHPLNPRSPYGASKCAARHLVEVYKHSYSLYAVQGWLFNHEGPRRGLDFVTRKISSSIARLKHSLLNNTDIPLLELGNINAQRDWSFAEDFMHGVWLMMNQKEPRNYILSSGTTHTVRDFLNTCLDYADLNYYSSGEGVDEEYYLDSGQIIFRVNPKFYRPSEVHQLCGDYSLAEKELEWKPTTTFYEIVSSMYKHDIETLNKIVNNS